jgi:hypothetical protein
MTEVNTACALRYATCMTAAEFHQQFTRAFACLGMLRCSATFGFHQRRADRHRCSPIPTHDMSQRKAILNPESVSERRGERMRCNLGHGAHGRLCSAQVLGQAAGFQIRRVTLNPRPRQ